MHWSAHACKSVYLIDLILIACQHVRDCTQCAIVALIVLGLIAETEWTI